MKVDYSLDAIPFSQFGLSISESAGVVDALRKKAPLSVDWPDAHGEVVDLSRPRFERREMELTGAILASNAVDFENKLRSLSVLLGLPGTRRLRIAVGSLKPLVYEVYAPEGISVKKKWREGRMVGQLTLQLIEPQPVKQVYKSLSATVSLSIATLYSPVTIHWGDGSQTIATGGTTAYQHTYGGTAGATYYVIISGEIEQMSLHQALNLELVWA